MGRYAAQHEAHDARSRDNPRAAISESVGLLPWCSGVLLVWMIRG